MQNIYNMKTVEIKVSWTDLNSINNAEKQKTKLENKGYNLVETKDILSISTSILIYQL